MPADSCDGYRDMADMCLRSLTLLHNELSRNRTSDHALPCIIYCSARKTHSDAIYKPRGYRILAGICRHKSRNTNMSWSHSVTDNRQVVCELLYISNVFVWDLLLTYFISLILVVVVRLLCPFQVEHFALHSEWG